VPTKVIGTWQRNSRILLANRPADGRKLLEGAHTSAVPSPGNWVVDLLTLKDGSSVAVVRGWASSAHGFPSATGRANISGVVQPAEDAPNEIAVTAKPLLTTKFLLSHSSTDVRDGFIVQSGVSGSLTQVVPTRQSFTSNGLRTLNVFYTFNWIFFALLLLLIWIRIVRYEVSSAQ
jgi:cytochrome oxidase assembly protein ShyY1